MLDQIWISTIYVLKTGPGWDTEWVAMKIESNYSHYLVSQNHLYGQGFCDWIFAKGTLFGEKEQWWDILGERPTSHEGVDICAFNDSGGQQIMLDDSFAVPVMFDGKVIDMFDDFLGKTLIVEHDYMAEGYQLHSMYGHVLPGKHMLVGKKVEACEVIAKLAPKNHPQITPHLHLSVLMVEKSYAEPVRWQSIQSNGLKLCNPLDYINDMVFSEVK